MIAGRISLPVGRRAHAEVLRPARRAIGTGLARRNTWVTRRSAAAAAGVAAVPAGRSSCAAAPELPSGSSGCGEGGRSSGGSAGAAGPFATRTRLLAAASGRPGRRFVVPRAYAVAMPRYDYRCRACGDTFEVTRPMRDSDVPATCPQGHTDTVKLLSTVAVTGRGAGAPAAPSGGGCCGGACRC
jgi:putative FmdB family regulatory protein